jgi:hypothetical protein
VQRFGFARKTVGPGIIYIGSNVNLMDETSLRSLREQTHDDVLAHLS